MPVTAKRQKPNVVRAHLYVASQRLTSALRTEDVESGRLQTARPNPVGIPTSPGDWISNANGPLHTAFPADKAGASCGKVLAAAPI